jgi:hypothetical protein
MMIRARKNKDKDEDKNKEMIGKTGLDKTGRD